MGKSSGDQQNIALCLPAGWSPSAKTVQYADQKIYVRQTGGRVENFSTHASEGK
jgi:hypothetical protein